MESVDYREFLESRMHFGSSSGFDPLWIPDYLHDFQKSLVEWAINKGRCAIFADCGMGKTPMQLVWAQNVVQKTNKPVLILTPLAVGMQTCIEAEKFHVEAHRCQNGEVSKPTIYVTNYERLHYFNHEDFGGVVCDESSILKNFDGKIKDSITKFMRKVQYRLLCTATAAPNDWIELGTSSECLGYLGYMDMLSKFFKNDQGTNHPNRKWSDGKWRFRGHAEHHFWRWVCSWSRALRKPSDLGFDDRHFILPNLLVENHKIVAREKREGFLFDMPAVGLAEEREENRRTIQERCELSSSITNSHNDSAVCWVNLNDESKICSSLIPNSVEVSGSDSDEQKEEKFMAFQKGDVRVIVTKPTIAGFGLNWQHCHRQTFFPSNSFEQWYQAIRRCWRFGQTKDVKVDVVASEGQIRVLNNLQRKADAAEMMFDRLVSHMNNELNIVRKNEMTKKEEIPSWL